MKFSLFQNDKSTAKDELLLLAFILVCVAIGLILALAAPGFWIIGAPLSRSFGVLLILTGVMFIPGLIYRWMTNDKGGAK